VKFARRGHLVPKALHANMFLVRRASEVMGTDILVLPADTAYLETSGMSIVDANV
jgi:chloride channel protein, CIC family